MWRVVLLVFCYHVVSQAEDESVRHTRELIECCPCPGSVGPDLGRLRSTDDCPCRPRGADSEGASSMLFPSRTANPKTSVPFMRSNDPNDIKNLLEPEVGLATSMLQTLREATEEEYRDALARDAARSSDTIPEESARNVVIIVKPRASDDEDIFVSEASNVKEARCINPLGSLGQMRSASKPVRPLPGFFRFPKPRQPVMHRNLWDMDSNVGASEVQPSVVDTGAESKPRFPMFKLRTPLKENPLRSSTNEGPKTPSVLDKLEQTFKNRPNIFERFNLPLVPNMKVDSPFRNSKNANTDRSSSPSNNQELIEKENSEGILKINKKPPLFKNLFKLKDVELIPKTIPKLPIFKSKLDSDKMLPKPILLNRDADDTCEDSNYDSAMNEKVLMPKQVSSKESFRDKGVVDKDSGPKAANILKPESIEDQNDAITSPSEIILSTMNKNTEESHETDCDDVTLEEMRATTEVSIVREEDGSNEFLDAAVESEIEDTGSDNNQSSKNCESKEVSNEENAVSVSDSNYNIVNGILLEDNSEDSLSFGKPEKGVNISGEDNKDFVSLRSAEDEAQSINIPTTTETINKKIIPNIKPIPPLSETLSAINENVKNSLESLKQTSKNVTPAFLSANDQSSDSKVDSLHSEQETQMNELIKETSDADSKLKENESQVTFNDLQKLSDDLLVLSSNNKETFTPNETETENNSNKANSKLNTEQKQTVENGQDSLEVETSTSITDEGTSDDAKVTSSKRKACKVGFDENETKREKMKSKSATPDEVNRDMSVEASAPIANTLPTLLDPLNLNEQLGSSLLRSSDPFNLNEKLGSPLLPNLDPLNLSEKLSSPILPNLDPLNLSLGSPMLDPLNLNEKLSFLQPNLDPLNVRSSLQDIVVQPTIANDPLNILGKPIAEVLKLPTLEDIRQRLSSVFDSDDRSAENNFSDEDTDFTNDAPIEMAHSASTNSLRKVPTIRPLENMNVDIFQLNPLSNPDLVSNTPRLNLNNFRTKLPIPNNLDLKPVKLESRVANNKGNILGASLSFGNDKMLRKAKPNANELGHPLGGLPSLDELRNTLQSKTQHLLGSPLHSNLDLFRERSLRASGIPDIDEIRRNAEKTFKGLQQRMKSTFKGGKISNPLGEKFARPQDLLEDMNDKLKAIHYDLNDRLSSIHEDILDQTRIKPLEISHFPTLSTNRNNNNNKVNNIWKPKGKPARLQTSASTISSQEIDPFENINDKKLRSSVRNSPTRYPSSAQRTLLGSESSPVASKVEFPKHKTTLDVPSKSTLPPLLRLPSPRQGSENIFPSTLRKPLALSRQPDFVKDLKRPVLKKPSPFKDKTNKVTITFATTTASPVTSPMNTGSFTTPSIKHYKPDVLNKNRDSLKERITLPRTKPIGDVKESASIRPNLLTSVKSKNNFKTAVVDKDFPQPQNVESTKPTKTRFHSFKETKDNLKLNKNTANKLSLPLSDNSESKNVAKPLVWPKTGEDSFLAKVREAMQARLNNFNPKPVENEEIPKVESMDMTKSASENQDIVIVDEPLKENVSYRCRMVCTRE